MEDNGLGNELDSILFEEDKKVAVYPMGRPWIWFVVVLLGIHFSFIDAFIGNSIILAGSAGFCFVAFYFFKRPAAVPQFKNVVLLLAILWLLVLHLGSLVLKAYPFNSSALKVFYASLCAILLVRLSIDGIRNSKYEEHSN